MNFSNLVVLIILFSLMLLIVQRTERRRRLLAAGILLVPAGWLIYRWAIYRNQVTEALIAAGMALVLNFLFWLLYGRKHPTRSSEEIKVIGMED